MNSDQSRPLDGYDFKLGPMDTMGKRLGAALALRHKEPPWLIATLGLSKGAIYNILNDVTKPDKIRAKTVTMICDALDVREEWFKTGDPPMTKAPLRLTHEVSGSVSAIGYAPMTRMSRVPIQGAVIVETDGFWRETEGIEGAWVDFPDADERAYAIKIGGDALHPIIRAGWLILVEPSAALQPGEFVLVRLKDGRSTVRELLWARDGQYALESIGGGARMTVLADDVASIHAVTGVLPPSKAKT